MYRRRYTLVWIVLSLVIGAIISTHFALPLIFSTLLLALNVVLLIIYPPRTLLYFSLVGLASLFVSEVDNPQGGSLDRRRDALLLLKFEDSTSATVMAEYHPNRGWSRSRYRVLCNNIDEERLSYGVIKGDLVPLDHEKRYNKVLLNSDYRANIYVSKVLWSRERKISLPERANRWATERIAQLGLSDQAEAMSSALCLGNYSDLEEGVVRNYRRSGTAHLLALSGLHLGIIALIIAFITRPLLLFHRGNILAAVISIVAIWAFAAIAGFSYSLQRAAAMLTLLHLTVILAKRYDPLNALLAAVAVIMVVDPPAINSLSFQLSVVAVLVIILLGLPLLRLSHTRLYALDFILSSFTISCVATIATLPIISYMFGYIALLSPIATLCVMACIFTIILLSLLWIILPLSPLSPLFREMINSATTIQNYIVEQAAAWEKSTIDYSMSIWGVILSYLFIALLCFAAQLWLSRSRSSAVSLRTKKEID